MYISAYLNSNNSHSIRFYTDSIEAISDTGYSHTLTYDIHDFVTYKPTTGELDSLSTHTILGKGTVRYTVMDDTRHKTDTIIQDTIHVPTLDVILMSP